MAPRYSAYSGMSCPRRVEQREHLDAPVHLRMGVQVELVGAEAPHDVLGRVGAVDAEDEELGPPASIAASCASTASLSATSSNSCGSTEIGRARTWVTCSPIGIWDATASGSTPRMSAQQRRKLWLHRRVWKLTTLLARRPSWIARRIVSGSTASTRASATECGRSERSRVRRALSHEAWRDVEVVVVERHGRVRLALELVHDRACEVAVDRHVALVPRAWCSRGRRPARSRGPRGSAG